MPVLFDGAGDAWSLRAFAPRVHANHLDNKALTDFAVRNLGCATLSMRGETPLLGYRAGYVTWDAARAAVAAALVTNTDKFALSEWGNDGVVEWQSRAQAVKRLLEAAEVRPAAVSVAASETLEASDRALVRSMNDDSGYPLDDGVHIYKRSSFGVTDDGEVYLETVGQGFELASRRALEQMRGRTTRHWEDPAYGKLVGGIVVRAMYSAGPSVTLAAQIVSVSGVREALRVYRRIVHYQGFRHGRHEVRMLTATLAGMSA